MTTRYPHFAGTPFGPLFSGPLGNDEGDCLYWYDCPIMWLCRDAQGIPWLVNSMGDDRENRATTYLVIPVSSGEEAELRKMTSDTAHSLLYRLYTDASGGWMVLESWDGTVVSANPAGSGDYAEARPIP